MSVGNNSEPESNAEVNATAFRNWLEKYKEMNRTLELIIKRNGTEINLLLRTESKLDVEAAAREILRMAGELGGKTNETSSAPVILKDGIITWAKTVDCQF